MLTRKKPICNESIDLQSIFYLHCERSQTWVISFDNDSLQCVPVTESLNTWEKQLPHFWRINESYLINPAIIYRFYPAEIPHFPLPLVELISGRVLAVSRQKTKTILQKWNRVQKSLIS
ncbi:LytTR family transcriptional regulator DNA-binding domain-containing protein [Larkinella rosea]|uniref:HTH LytTR-type domain-containing protein n=1 Tax=Larkinella rosea TaxID=2025312 RepID=A0A3P1BSH9_9BACT|nr:LytTR family transcriptional regulator DNA-binding domain-containing protein [Larkinella rosea]RRB03816.1 hypothetical protein EHT25_09765 [Larkinella rosea]